MKDVKLPADVKENTVSASRSSSSGSSGLIPSTPQADAAVAVLAPRSKRHLVCLLGYSSRNDIIVV